MIEIRGFITNLGRYNEGTLLGEWITFPIEEEELEEVLQRIGVSDKPNEDGDYYEEYFFTDWEYEGTLAEECHVQLELKEYMNVEAVNDLAEKLEDVDERILGAIQECTYPWDIDACVNIYKENKYIYYGTENTLDDIAQSEADEWMHMNIQDKHIVKWVQRYFDYKSYARDLKDCRYYQTKSGVIQILD